MQRRVLGDIESWNAKNKRKPLVRMGARQVGKTWLMEEFAKRAYPCDTVTVNFVASPYAPHNCQNEISTTAGMRM